MRSVRVAVLLAVSSLPQVVLAQIDQTSTAARFRAANLLLSEVIQALARFQYPELDTSDFSQKVAPYQNFLENLKNDVRREGKLNDSKLAALSFFAAPASTTLKISL